jgi:hypothetical protein
MNVTGFGTGKEAMYTRHSQTVDTAASAYVSPGDSEISVMTTRLNSTQCMPTAVRDASVNFFQVKSTAQDFGG